MIYFSGFIYVNRRYNKFAEEHTTSHHNYPYQYCHYSYYSPYKCMFAAKDKIEMFMMTASAKIEKSTSC